MRLLKTLTTVVILTLTALIYVHQQVELVKLSYAIEYKEKRLKEMLDRNEGLGYNIKNLESPSRLEKVLLSKKIDVAFPKKAEIVSIRNTASRGVSEERLKTAGLERKAHTLWIFDFFSPRAEAQAKEK